MKSARTLTALGLDHDRLCAVGASVGSEGVKVKGWAAATMPAGMDARDAEAVGAWIGKELEAAGLGKGKLVFAVPRGEVVLKRLKLPRGDGVGETELAGMVRLQMARQLTMAMEGTAIDYVPVGGAAEADGGAKTASVMAVALPGDRVAWYQGVADAAGAKVERLGLSSSGAAAYLAGASQRRTGPVMGVSVGSRAVEFVVVEDGQLGFARSADVGPSGEGSETPESLVQRIAVEAKRTWMSYRVSEESAEVDAVVVAGEGDLATELGRKCGEALEMTWEVAGAPMGVRLPSEMPEPDRLMASPLIGLLLEESLDRPVLDLAHPRKAPDLAAARRQKVLLAALALIIAGGGAFLYANRSLAQLRARVNDAAEQDRRLSADYTAFLKAHARLSHLEAWKSAKVDWIAHVRWLADQMPDPRQALLDGISGSLKAAVTVTPKQDWYDKYGWAVQQQAAFAMQGHAKVADVSRGLRERLLAPGVYQVDTKGADTPDQFQYVLTTSRVTPDGPPEGSGKPASKSSKPEKGGSQ